MIGLAGCYSEDSEIVQSERTSHRTSELSLILRSLSAHEASFDNVIDNTSCFSIDFPYQINLNSESTTIAGLEDLANITQEDDIELIFPINTTFFNYESQEVLSQTEFNLIKNSCNRDFNIILNLCYRLQYPVTFKEYNNLTESFETFHLHSDEEVFVHIQNLHDNDVYELEYPLILKDHNNASTFINSNDELFRLIGESSSDCL